MSGAFLLAGVLAVVALLARRIEGSWVAPGPLFAMMWSGILAISSIAFPDLDPLADAGLYLLAASVALIGGSLLGHAAAPAEKPSGVALPGLVPRLRVFLLVAILLGLGLVPLVFMRRGFSIAAVLSYAAIAQVTAANRTDLYAKVFQQSVGEWLVYVVLYAATLLGGILFRLSQRTWDRLLGLGALVTLCLVFGLYGSRFGALYGGTFWVAAYLATAVLVAEDPQIIKPARLAAVVAIGLTVLIGFSVATMVVRYSGNFSAVGWRRILADGFAFPGALGIWLQERGWVGSGFALGARTFTKLVAPLGIHEAPIPERAVGFTASNIFTVNRDLIEDFGTLGSLVFFVALGWIGRVLYARVLAGRGWALPPLMVVYAFILTMPAVGFFFYTAPTLALAAVSVFALLAFRVRPAATGRTL